MTFASWVVVMVGLAAAPPAPSPAPDLRATLAQLDALHARRADPAARQELARVVDRAVAASPRDPGVLWRAARQAFWEGDDPSLPNDVRSRWGKRGMELGARAVEANPTDAAGYYWSAVNVGNYAVGLGVVRALTEGLEGKFRDLLGRAEQLDPRFQHGNVYSAWGRFYAMLPWPKRDARKAEVAYRRALELDPANVRAKEWLAELLAREDRPDEARRLLTDVLASASASDPAELPRAKLRASWALQKLPPK
jgi:cytochrome c-type biogenesis protein CcmH/NrfG